MKWSWRISPIVWHILCLTLAWRAVHIIIGALADRFVAYAPTFPYFNTIFIQFNAPRWWYSWANFDGVHYLTIIEKGYVGTGLIQAFFPLYPVTVKILSIISGVNALQAGLVLSLVATLIGLVVWFYLLAAVTSRVVAERWWWVVLLMPTSFFLTAFYTESLFMLLVWGSLYLGIKRQWGWAALLIALASATRVTGVFLVPALWIEWWWQQRHMRSTQRTSFVPLLITSLGGSGLAAYMAYLWRTFGDPLYFFHVQSEFGGGRQETIVLLPQVIWRYIKILVTVRPINWQYYAFAQEVVVALGALLIMILGWKKVRPSVLIFSLLAWILPTLTGTFSSMPRYVLACPAVVVVLIMWLDRTRHYSWLKWLVIAGGLIWSAINITLFVQGYWVA